MPREAVHLNVDFCLPHMWSEFMRLLPLPQSQPGIRDPSIVLADHAPHGHPENAGME